MSISKDEVEHSCGCSRGLTIAGGSADSPPAASCPIDAAVCPQTTVCGILSELWLVHQQCTSSGAEQRVDSSRESDAIKAPHFVPSLQGQAPQSALQFQTFAILYI